MSIGSQIRNPIWVRFADPEKEPVSDWLQANIARNAFDKAVLYYPATKVLAAHNGKTIAYMPVQSVAVLESVGVRPDSTALEQAAAIIELVKAAATLAHGAGFRELMFLASDPVTEEGAKKLGFQEVPYRMMRFKL